MHRHNKLLHLQTDIYPNTDHRNCEMSPVSDSTNTVVPGTQEPEEKIYHPPDGLFTDAHMPDFNAYLALYKKSTEHPEGKLKCTHMTE